MLVLAEIRRYAAWLDDARLFCGFGHASDDALARAVTIDANAGEVTTYSDDLGADVVPFFDRVVAGAPHGYAVAVSRPGLALVACNLARDVVVVRRDPDDATGGAWYLAERIFFSAPSRGSPMIERTVLVSVAAASSSGTDRGGAAGARRRGSSDDATERTTRSTAADGRRGQTTAQPLFV